MRSIVRDVMHPKLRGLYDSWDAHRPSPDKLPRYKTLLPPSLAQYRKHLILIQVNGDDYVYRHYGAHFIENFGKDMTGNAVSSLPEEQVQLIKFEYDYVRKRRIPSWRSYTAEFDNGLVTWERLALPLAGEDDEIALLMVAAYEATRR